MLTAASSNVSGSVFFWFVFVFVCLLSTPQILTRSFSALSNLYLGKFVALEALGFK